MDRTAVERLLANARTRDIVTVHLPGIDEDFHLYTSVSNDEALRVMTAGGADDDQAARQLVGILRFILVDEDGALLLRTFGEASALVAALGAEDLQVLFEKLQEIAAGASTVGDLEVGKAS